MAEENFNNDEFDDSTLSEGARAVLKAAEEAAGVGKDGPGSTADFKSMDKAPFLALADVAAGAPWTTVQPEGLTRVQWRRFLIDRGFKVAE